MGTINAVLHTCGIQFSLQLWFAIASNSSRALSGRFLRCSCRNPSGPGALPDFSSLRLLLSSSIVKSCSNSCLGPRALIFLATSTLSLLVSLDVFPATNLRILADKGVCLGFQRGAPFSFIKHGAAIAVDHLSSSQLLNHTPRPPRVSLLADLVHVFNPYVCFFASLVFSFSSLQMFTHLFLRLPISLLARFLSLRNLFISAVIRGIFSALMTFVGHTFIPASIIREVNFANFSLMFSSPTTSTRPSSISSLYLLQSPFFKFGSVLITFLLILASLFQLMATGTWSEDRSSIVPQLIPALSSIGVIDRSGTDRPGLPVYPPSQISDTWWHCRRSG